MEYESAVCGVEELVEEDGDGAKWEEVLKRMENSFLALESGWNTVNLLSLTTDKLEQDRFNQLLRRAERALLTKFGSRTLYDYLKSLGEIEGEEGRILERYNLEYKHQGYELPHNKYMALNAHWMKRLAEAQRDTRFKLSMASERFRHVIRDPAVVREFPVDLLRAMSVDTSQPAKGPWSVTLHPYVYRKFLQYCPDRRLRWNAFNADRSRGSSSMDVYLNVAGHIKDIRQHRLDQASTLGYYNYAEMSLASKMAGSLENVQSMIASLLPAAKAAQEAELASLQQYAESRGFDDTIREFDVPFFRRKQLRTVLGIEEESVREHFPLPTVLKGVFSLLEQQFGLTFTLATENESSGVWSPEVSLYRVDENGKEVGHLYVDPYYREDKSYQGGDKGYYIPLRSASDVGEGKPLGALVLSLPPPGYGKPSLLSLPEIEELVKKIGKTVVHMLGRRKWAETSGVTGLEFDVVNLMSDLLSHWLSVPSVLASLSGHWSTGAQLNHEEIAKLVASRNHMAGYDLSHELFKSAYDIEFYSEDPENENYQTLAARLWPQYLVQDREKEDAFPLYFEDMMTGHWAGSYYSHTWSKMLAADIFSAYTEAGLDNPQAVQKVSSRLKKTFLSAGSAIPPAQLFREFRGRDPTPEALLISLGLKDSLKPRSKSASN